ncbi:type II secretion system F family protein [Candidatus Woesearchaeota archaeon]|nr:type II secretion system F family protein [Candidatus Woesearchaeota archaeon]
MEILGVKIEKKHYIGFSLGGTLLIVDVVSYFGSLWFFPGIILSIIVGLFPILSDYFNNVKLQNIYEIAFLDFVRNLVGAVKSGMPISAAIIDASKNNYGPLTPHVHKLAHQVEWSIPIHKALLNFANSIGNRIIERAISTVIEAEMAGGNIEDVLDSITKSLISIKEIKMKRDSSVHSQVVQSYVIFVIFLGVMIVIQNLLIPYISSLSTSGAVDEFGDLGGGSSQATIDFGKRVEIDYSSLPAFVTSIVKWIVSFQTMFMMLALFQGFFSGLVLGQLATGSAKQGIKHSFILTLIAFLAITISQAIMG